MPNAPVPAAAPGLPSSRRGFLRGLTSLPLVGGAVTLIGAPTAVAESASRRLMAEYETWLACEARQVARELRPGESLASLICFDTPAWDWHRAHEGVLAPSTRAALVLATVDCNWRGGR